MLFLFEIKCKQCLEPKVVSQSYFRTFALKPSCISKRNMRITGSTLQNLAPFQSILYHFWYTLALSTSSFTFRCFKVSKKLWLIRSKFFFFYHSKYFAKKYDQVFFALCEKKERSFTTGWRVCFRSVRDRVLGPPHVVSISAVVAEGSDKWR